MQELQQQEQDITGSYTICGEAALPGTSCHEYCNEIVHQESRRRAMMRWQTIASEMAMISDFPGHLQTLEPLLCESWPKASALLVCER
jgi:hypothetical protein